MGVVPTLLEELMASPLVRFQWSAPHAHNPVRIWSRSPWIGQHLSLIEYATFLIVCSPSSWINTLYLSMDANFKLKQKNRGFIDPPLADGLSYMVSDRTLKEHLAECEKKRLNHEVSPINLIGVSSRHRLFILDQYMRVHLSCCEPSSYKVFGGIFCNWCWCG